jgi:hypothetical protein
VRLEPQETTTGLKVLKIPDFQNPNVLDEKSTRLVDHLLNQLVQIQLPSAQQSAEKDVSAIRLSSEVQTANASSKQTVLNRGRIE